MSDCKTFPWISHAAALLWLILTQSTTFSSPNPNISANSRTHETMSLFRAAPVLIICTLTRAPSHTGSLFLHGGQLLGVSLHYLTASIHYTSRNLIHFRLLLQKRRLNPARGFKSYWWRQKEKKGGRQGGNCQNQRHREWSHNPPLFGKPWKGDWYSSTTTRESWIRVMPFSHAFTCHKYGIFI